MMAGRTVHASVVLVGDSGVLIRGPSGSGKSSLLLALLSHDSKRTALVADDRVALSAANGRVLATVPHAIAGFMEVRGQGLIRRAHVSPVVVDLVVDLAPPETCPRMPETDQETRVTIADIALRRVFIPLGAADGARRVTIAVDR